MNAPIDLALGAAILTALLLVATDAPTWLTLLGSLGVGCAVRDYFTADTDTTDTDTTDTDTTDTTGDDPR